VGAQKTKRKETPQQRHCNELISRRNKVLDSKGICLFAHKMYQSFCHQKKEEGEARKKEEEEEEVRGGGTCKTHDDNGEYQYKKEL
jgi:hypothetical protein